ncbi:inactive heparanase-2-like [Littorina saxatilis]|uniref:inactive heparanase-2-like n=1 Tax=Littorina saxatilis TaxID=31220 RepID=UPI0038B50CF0
MFLQLTTILLHLALCTATKDVVHLSVRSPQGDRTRPKEDNSAAEVATVTANLQQAVNRIGSHFVGVTIDSQQVRYNWNSFDFGSTKVQNMAKALSPSYFRLGGTAADYMTFDPTNQKGHKGENLHGGQVYCSNFTTQFYMSADQWDILNKFLRAVGWDFIMDLNALQRNTDMSWNPANARQLLQYSASKNYTIAGFQLGNELNAQAVSPAQLAADYVTLQNVLGEFPQDYYSSFLVGPETPRNGDQFYFPRLEADRLSKEGSKLEQSVHPSSYGEEKTLLRSHFRAAWRERLHLGAEEDDIHQLDRKQQVAIFRLRTGHCQLLSHLYRLKISHTDQCPCGTGPQTPEHVLQACPTFDTLRRQTWPSEVQLREKLWGTAASLRPTAGFALNTGLDI